MTSDKMNDNVEHPEHYCTGGVECIDAIRSALGDKYPGYCQGNALKYVWRYDKKGKPIEDLKKARAYIDFLIEYLEDGAGVMCDDSR